ncbi:hypothetical protein EV361DRAFT_954182 [Lentinula raphanica]|nr:hypothetical protein EV361DRAFT_954182 [Lentinula raphanica]
MVDEPLPHRSFNSFRFNPSISKHHLSSSSHSAPKIIPPSSNLLPTSTSCSSRSENISSIKDTHEFTPRAHLSKWGDSDFLPAPRTMRRSSSILNNSFRPNVQAKDRLYAWSSPFALDRRERESLFIPANVRDQAERIQAKGHADSTKTSYAAGLLRFHQFCDSNGILEEDRIPAHPILILGFIALNTASIGGILV